MTKGVLRLTIFVLVGLSIGISFIPQPGNAEPPTPPISLPAPRECADAIEGTWVSVVNYPLRAEWYLFQLTVRRRAEAPEALTGEITARVWLSPAEQPLPVAPCQGLLYDYTIRQPGEGVLRGTTLSFQATSWELASVRCPPEPSGYTLDKIHAALLSNGKEFTAEISEIGPRAAHQTAIFRRICCANDPVQPVSELVKPAIKPTPRTKTRFGCSMW